MLTAKNIRTLASSFFCSALLLLSPGVHSAVAQGILQSGFEVTNEPLGRVPRPRVARKNSRPFHHPPTRIGPLLRNA